MKEFPAAAIPNSGFLPDFISYVKEFSNTPCQYSYFTAITILGLVMGRQVSFESGDTNIYPNFYICLMGKPSQFKSTSFKTGEKFLKAFQSAVNTKLVIPEDNSNESFKAWVLEHPKGLYPMDEMANWLKLGGKQFADEIKTLLIKFYDCPDDYPINRQATGLRYVQRPFISAYATSTFELFSEYSRETDLSSGFYARVLWVPSWIVEKPIPLPPPYDRVQKLHLEKFMVGLSQRVESANHGRGVELVMSDEAYDVYTRWFEKWYVFRGGIDYRLMDLVSKLPQMVIKVAMVLHMAESENRKISRAAMLQAGIAMNWILDMYQHINYEFSFGDFEKQRNKIIRILRDATTPVSKTKLLQNSHLKKRQLEEILETMIASELIDFHDGRPMAYSLKIAQNSIS